MATAWRHDDIRIELEVDGDEFAVLVGDQIVGWRSARREAEWLAAATASRLAQFAQNWDAWAAAERWAAEAFREVAA